MKKKLECIIMMLEEETTVDEALSTVFRSKIFTPIAVRRAAGTEKPIVFGVLGQ